MDCNGNFVSQGASYFGFSGNVFSQYDSVNVCACVAPTSSCPDITVLTVGPCRNVYLTPTPSNSPTVSVTANLTPTATSSNTPTPTNTSSNTPTPTITPTGCNCVEYTFKNLEPIPAVFTATDCNGNVIDYTLEAYLVFTTCLCEGTINIYNNWIEIAEGTSCSPPPTPTPTPSVTSSQTPTPTPTLTQPCSGCLEYEIFGGVASGATWELTYCSGGTETVEIAGYSVIQVCLSTPPVLINSYVGFQGTIYTYYVVLDCCGGATPTPTETPTNTPTVTTTQTPTKTSTPTRTPTNTQTPSITPTNTITPTKTVTPSVTPTNTVTPTKTTTPTNTQTPTRTQTPTQTPTETPGQVELYISNCSQFTSITGVTINSIPRPTFYSGTLPLGPQNPWPCPAAGGGNQVIADTNNSANPSSGVYTITLGLSSTSSANGISLLASLRVQDPPGTATFLNTQTIILDSNANQTVTLTSSYNITLSTLVDVQIQSMIPFGFITNPTGLPTSGNTIIDEGITDPNS